MRVRSFFFLPVIAALAGCVGTPDNVGSSVETENLVADGEGVVVAEAGGLGECSFSSMGFGPGPGPDVDDHIVTGETEYRGDPPAIASTTFPAGTHHLLNFTCVKGSTKTQRASFIEKPGMFVIPKYRSLGTFEIAPGEVIYIGRLSPGVLAARVENRSEIARAHLARTNPDLAQRMEVRLLKVTLPRD